MKIFWVLLLISTNVLAFGDPSTQVQIRLMDKTNTNQTQQLNKSWVDPNMSQPLNNSVNFSTIPDSIKFLPIDSALSNFQMHVNDCEYALRSSNDIGGCKNAEEAYEYLQKLRMESPANFQHYNTYNDKVTKYVIMYGEALLLRNSKKILINEEQ